MTGALLAGRYRLDESVRVGVASELWRGTDVRTGMTVAVKLSKPARSPVSDPYATWRAEVEASRSFGHRLLVPSFVAGRDSACSYLVRGFAPGRSLDTVLAEGPLPAGLAGRLAAGACDLLATARGYGVAHLGVVPRHVMLDDLGGFRIIDFLAGDEDGPISFDSQWFLAPEQRTAALRTEAEDVYNAGALLYESCTATVTTGSSRDEAYAAQDRATAGLLAVARHALAVSPLRRYRTLADMAGRLERYAKPGGAMAR